MILRCQFHHTFVAAPPFARSRSNIYFHGGGIERTETAAMAVKLILHIACIAAEHAVAVIPFLDSFHFQKSILVQVGTRLSKPFYLTGHTNGGFIVSKFLGCLQTFVIVAFFFGFGRGCLKRLNEIRSQCGRQT